MDPLSLPLSCTCVPGTGQRRYDLLAKHIEKTVQLKVEVLFDESLTLALTRLKKPPDFIVGKKSIVEFDAATEKIQIKPLAKLTGLDGRTDLRGVFLVRKENKSKGIKELLGQKIVLGPVEDEDAHAAAIRTLKATGVFDQVEILVAGSIDSGAVQVGDKEADVAVVSSFMPPLLEGCGKFDRGSMRVLGETQPVPFVEFFATEHVSLALEMRIRKALDSVRSDLTLLGAMESKSGFELIQPVWPDWRGMNRDGRTALPQEFPPKLKLYWSVETSGPAMSGVAVNERYVLLPDKNKDLTHDVFRCLSVKTGKLIWELTYPAPHELDYSNAPRATPVIDGDRAYLLGALGDLHCVELDTGKVIWKKNLFLDFKADLLNWGSTSAPLIVDNKIIINPGAPRASVVALDKKTGKILWRAKGRPAAYGAFIQREDQIIGYDSVSIGGWDVETGKRAWSVTPPDGSDFNVTTPLLLGDQLFLATENNGARLYAFDKTNKIIEKPIERNDDLAPDTCTPVVWGGKLFATAYGELYCLIFGIS